MIFDTKYLPESVCLAQTRLLDHDWTTPQSLSNSFGYAMAPVSLCSLRASFVGRGMNDRLDVGVDRRTVPLSVAGRRRRLHHGHPMYPTQQATLSGSSLLGHNAKHETPLVETMLRQTDSERNGPALAFPFAPLGPCCRRRPQDLSSANGCYTAAYCSSSAAHFGQNRFS